MPNQSREITRTDVLGALRLLGIYLEQTLEPRWKAKIKALPDVYKNARTGQLYQNRINRARGGLADLKCEVERMADE